MGEDLSVLHSFQTATGPNHPHISGNCGSFSCDKTVGGDDLRPYSAMFENASNCACWRAACVSTMATNKE
jgi:hypothetical protein